MLATYYESLFYVEQKAKIGTIELSMKQNRDEKSCVSISSRSIRVNDSDVNLCEDTNIRFQDIAGVTVADSIVNVKISTDPILMIPAPSSKNKDTSRISTVTCLRCSHPITCKKFSRTLPLPSAAWYEMADTLICHGSHKKVANGCYPRPGDCLVGEEELWISWNMIKTANVYIGNVREMEKRGTARVTASLHCHRCRNTLGRVVYQGDQVDWTIIWKHSIQSKSAECPYHIESYIARELMDTSTRHLSYRFVILPREQVSTTTAMFHGIRLWMMGGDMIISSSLTDIINKVIAGIGGKFSDSSKAMKVLYTKHTEHGLSDIWNDADIISLPLDLCLHLWLTLQLSSLTLPPSKRFAQNCRIGYIRYSTEHKPFK